MYYFLYIMHGVGKQNSMWCQLALVLRDTGVEKKMPIPGWGGEALPNFFLGWDLEIFQGVRGGCRNAAKKFLLFW